MSVGLFSVRYSICPGCRKDRPMSQGNRRREDDQRLLEGILCKVCTLKEYERINVCPEIFIQQSSGYLHCQLAYEHEGRCLPAPPGQPEGLNLYFNHRGISNDRG